MSKSILTATILIICLSCYAQNNNGTYFNNPFPIYNSSGEVIIAGSVNTFIYSNYYGRDVKKENFTNPHVKPEYLVYELFRNIKIKNIHGLDKLYDTSFHQANFDINNMAELLKNYTDIKFQSKFISGDRVVIRYDFVSQNNPYPYFATIRKVGNEYYLTTDLNLSDPFNVIGSLSPYNLLNKQANAVKSEGLIAFHFIEKDNKIFYTTQIPDEAYSSVYLSFEFFNNNTGIEAEFIKQVQKAARSTDTSELKNFLAKDEMTLLSDTHFKSYFYSEIKKIFSNYSSITALASIKINDGKILYFKYSSPGQSSNIASILLKKEGNKYYLSLRMKEGDAANVLQNNYVKEAIYDYLKARP